MKKIVFLVFLMISISAILLINGCDKNGNSNAENKTVKESPDSLKSAPAEEPEFDPDEPAPVPEGTPPY